MCSVITYVITVNGILEYEFSDAKKAGETYFNLDLVNDLQVTQVINNRRWRPMARVLVIGEDDNGQKRRVKALPSANSKGDELFIAGYFEARDKARRALLMKSCRWVRNKRNQGWKQKDFAKKLSDFLDSDLGCKYEAVEEGDQ